MQAILPQAQGIHRHVFVADWLKLSCGCQRGLNFTHFCTVKISFFYITGEVQPVGVDVEKLQCVPF